MATASASDLAGAAPLPSRRRWTIYVIAGLALMMVGIDQTIVATALPEIQHQLNARVNVSAWTITIYALVSATTYPIVGRVVDRRGARPVFVGAIGLFTLASICCGLSTNIYELIAFRGVQAIGGAAVLPAATKIVTLTFGASRDRALGSFIAIFSIGSLTGPILGGLIIHYASWQDIFFVSVPIGLLLIFAGRLLLPQTPPGASQPIDGRGLCLMVAAVLSAMLGTAYLGEPDASVWDPMTVGSYAVTLVAVPYLIRHLRTADDPFIPVRLLYGREFGTLNILNVVYGATILGFGALVPLYAITRFDMPELEAGTLLTARAIGSIVVAAAAVALLRRTGYRKPILIGFVAIGIGQLGIALCPSADVAYIWLSVATGLTGIGMGAANPATNNASMQLLPDDTASVAALRAMFRQIGGVAAVAITTAFAARSSDPGLTQAIAFAAFGVALVSVTLLLRRVPEHRGEW